MEGLTIDRKVIGKDFRYCLKSGIFDQSSPLTAKYVDNHYVLSYGTQIFKVLGGDKAEEADRMLKEKAEELLKEEQYRQPKDRID